MEDLNRSQFILLVLLVTFVTSVATAIVTATLVNQAPSPITQTVNKVIEKTVETITLSKSDNINSGDKQNEPQVVFVTEEELVTKVVSNASPAVASVVVTKDVLGGGQQVQVSGGTGFFVSKDGYFITNKHVVADTRAEYSIITNANKKFPAKVLARDPVYDIAILKIDPLAGEAGGENFSFVPLADSGNIKVGQTVIAIGNTLGEFQNTVSTGIVSGLNRSVLASDSTGRIERLDMLIQTDAAISSGNSGGPLLNLQGEVVGINTAVAVGAENVGFALPANFARKGIADVQEFGRIRYAFLGVVYLAIDSNTKEEKELSVDYGILVVAGSDGGPAVMEESPADKAGIVEGDIILEFDGRQINMANTLGRIIADKRVGDTVTLKILRGEEEMEVSVVLDERPETL